LGLLTLSFSRALFDEVGWLVRREELKGEREGVMEKTA
jgi:hypothetical protein